MKNKLRTTFLSVFLSIFGVLALSVASHASCTGDNRISLGSASCLDGGWDNSCTAKIFGKCIGWSSSYWAQATATCTAGSDKVVVKIDLKSQGDRTWHLTGFTRSNGQSNTKTNGVYCCDDLGRCN